MEVCGACGLRDPPDLSEEDRSEIMGLVPMKDVHPLCIAFACPAIVRDVQVLKVVSGQYREAASVLAVHLGEDLSDMVLSAMLRMDRADGTVGIVGMWHPARRVLGRLPPSCDTRSIAETHKRACFHVHALLPCARSASFYIGLYQSRPAELVTLSALEALVRNDPA